MDHVEVRIESSAFSAEVEVREYEGRESISSPFEWELMVVCRGGRLNADDIVGAPAKLTLLLDGAEYRYVHGVLAECVDLLTTQPSYTSYRLLLVPTMWLTSMVENIDIFMDQTLPDLLRFKLGLASLEEDIDYELRLTTDYPLREFVVQFQETDLAFVSRQCEHFGVSYHFEHNETQDVLVLGDHNHAFPPVSGEQVTFMPRGEHTGIFELSSVTKVIPRQYVQRDYNYRAPDVDLVGQSALSLAGTAGGVYQYGGHFKTNAEAAMIAEIRAQERLCTRKVFSGRSVVPALSAGHVVEVVDHPNGNIPLLLTTVTHSGTQGSRVGGEGENKYQNSFSAIDSATVYRPPQLIEKPHVTGMLTGIVESRDGSEYADVDEHGRYRVRFLFDTAGEGERQASRPVRMMQPHSGAGFGVHFPLRHGTEVLITFVGGDPDRPIIAGTVPNPQTASPVNATNRERNVIRTGGSNEINIDDTKGDERIKISVPHQDTVFQLGAPNFPESGAALQTKGAQTEIATQGITGAGAFQSTLSSFVNWLLSSTVVTDAGPPTGLELLQTGVELYGGACDVALAVIAMERAKLLAEEKQAAQEAFEASNAATKAQQRCRSCRSEAMSSLPAPLNDPVEVRRQGELAAAKAAADPPQSLTQAEQEALAIYEYEQACDADDDTYLTAIGTLEDRNGIVMAAREGTNPDFDPVMDRDAWEEVRKYDDDLFVEMRTQWDRERWDNSRDGRETDDPLYPDMLTIDEKIAYHDPDPTPSNWDTFNDEQKAAWYYDNNNVSPQDRTDAFNKWQVEEQARWDPNYFQRLQDEQAWTNTSKADKAARLSPDPNGTFDAQTAAQKAASIDPPPAGWADMDDAAKAAHWSSLSQTEQDAAKNSYVTAAWDNASTDDKNAVEQGFLEEKRLAWPEVPSKLARDQKKAAMMSALSDSKYDNYKSALNACHSGDGGCAKLDELRKTAIEKEEAYCENMRSHGEELRTLREKEIEAQKHKDYGSSAPGAALSIIMTIISLVKASGARSSLRGKWKAAKTMMTHVPLQKAAAADMNAKAREEFNQAHAGTPNGVGIGEIKRRTMGRFAYWPFGTYVHHVGSDNDLSLGAGDTITMATKTALILGMGSMAPPGAPPGKAAAAGAAFLNKMAGTDIFGEVPDPDTGNVFIMGGASVRVGSGTELELGAGDTMRMSAQKLRVQASDHVQLASTKVPPAGLREGYPDRNMVKGELYLKEDETLMRTFHDPVPNPPLELAKVHLKGPVLKAEVHKSGGATAALIEATAFTPGAHPNMSAQLKLTEVQTADLLADAWGLRADGNAGHVSVGNAGWELKVADQDIKLGVTGANAQLSITQNETKLLGNTVRLGAGGGTVSIDANNLVIGPAALQSANLVVKGEMNAKVTQLRQTLTQAIQGAGQAANRAQRGVRKLKRRVRALEQE